MADFDTKKCRKCGGPVLFECVSCGTGGETFLYATCCKLVITTQNASTSYVQRQLRIGFNLAAKLIDRMEKEKLISQPNHVGRRTVLVREVPKVQS